MALDLLDRNEEVDAQHGTVSSQSATYGLVRQPRTWDLQAALDEFEAAAYSVVGDVLHKARISASEVDIVITACTCLTPCPSLSAMIANRFKMRGDLRNYSLGGQGCAAGVIAVELAQQLLRAEPDRIALLVTHESATAGLTFSEHPETLISNILFRTGAAAVLLTNRRTHRRSAKYRLRHAVRAMRTDDDSFGAILRREDSGGRLGVFLTGKPVVAAATAVLRDAFRALAPLILPLRELVPALRDPKYKPDWNTALDHILIHTGAALVIRSVSQALGLRAGASNASSETMHRFGNLSASSTFYILANLETQGNIRKGNRVLQLGFGSGFKAAAAFWVALRDVQDAHPAWAPRLPGHIEGAEGHAISTPVPPGVDGLNGDEAKAGVSNVPARASAGAANVEGYREHPVVA